MTTALEGVDDKARVRLVTAVGPRERARIRTIRTSTGSSLDGTGMKLLNPGDASHAVEPVRVETLLRRQRVAGRHVRRLRALRHDRLPLVTKLETADLSALTEPGFRFPEPFTVKADDGITDLYGVMYKPFDFDPAQKYPIILYVYPGPQQRA